jgi:hypothetical protein
VIALLTVPLLICGIVLGGRFGLSRVREPAQTLDLNQDLPCPWCLSPTGEHDRSCPSCGRTFGDPQKETNPVTA